MNRLLLLIAFVASTLLYNASNAQEFTLSAEKIDVTNPQLEKKFYNYEVFSISSKELKSRVANRTKSHDWVLELPGFNVEMEIIPAYIRTEDYTLRVQGKDEQTVHRPKENKVFKGYVKNDVNGKVRLVIDDNFIYGYFEMGRERYFIEPLHMVSDVKSYDQYVVYKADETKPFKDIRCAADDLAENQAYYENHAHDHDDHEAAENRAAGQCYKVELAIASDFSMFSNYGGIVGVENRNLGVLNNVQGNYDDEFADEIEFDVVTQFVSDCSSCDPWSASTDSEVLLNSFTNWGNNGGFGVGFDLGSLWSRRNFDGSTIGLAWVSGLCTNIKYHVLEDFSSNAEFLRVLWAHEMGHNFSAGHDAAGSNTIMAPSVNAATSWSAGSQTSINALIAQRAAQGNCFSSCGGDPVVDIQILNPVVCPGGQVVFFDNSLSQPEAIDWFWEFDGGNPATSNERNPIITYTSPGFYDVTLTVTNSFGDATATFPGVIEVSGGGTDVLVYNDFQNGIGWPIDNPDGGLTWETVLVDGLFYGDFAARVDNFNYVAAGQRDGMISPTFDLTGRASANVNIVYAHRRFNTTQDSLVVYISTDGGANFNTRIFRGAENGTGNFATNPDLNTIFVPGDTDDWCFDGFFGAECISIDLTQFAGQSNLAIKVENYNEFGNPIYVGLVYVEAACFAVDPPVADFIGVPNEGCIPMLVDYTDQSTNNPDTWSWSFPGGVPATSSDPNPSILYETPGVYPVTLTVSNSAGSDELTVSDYITVGDVPTADFTTTVNGRTVTFNNASSNADSYSWDFGDGNTSIEENPTHTYSEDGTYTVKLTATNDCGDATAMVEMMIDAQPTADFTANVTSGCAPLAVQFTNGSSDNATSLNWTFEGGNPGTSTDEDPLVTYATPGTYDVTLVASNADGSDTLVMVDFITVGGAPEADFGYSINLNTVNFSDSTTGADSLMWYFGDGSTSNMANPTNVYAEDGTYTVILVGYNDCGTDTATVEIVINTEATANVSASTTSGCVPLTVHFSDSNSTNATSRMWIFEGGTPGMSTSANPTVVYNNAGSFDVTLIVSNGVDSDTAVFADYITVNPLPNAAFDYELDGTTVTITDMSTNVDNYMWFFGDGNSSTDENPMHTYASAGVFPITLVASNACGSDTTVRSVSIGSAPVADFESPRSICPGEGVIFDNQSSSNAESYIWIFEGGMPDTSMDENPWVVYNTPGTYDVTLIATNSFGSDTIVKTDYITVLAPPTADFDFTVNGTLTVEFMSNATNALSVAWDFGDGTVSTDDDPVHAYAAVGTYTVTHTAYGVCDTVTSTQEVGVSLAPVAGFTASETSGCLPLEVQFSDASSGTVDTYEWTFEGGTPATSNDANPTVTYNAPGSYDVTLVVTNASGTNSLVMSDFITVNDAPLAGFTWDVSADTVFFTNQSIDAVSYLWSFGDGSTSDQASPSHIYDASGTWDVQLIAINECGSDTVSFDVVDVDDVDAEMEVRLYPVPADEYLIVDMNGPFYGNHQVRLIDMLGRTVQQFEFDKRSDAHQLQIPVMEMAPAAYFVEIASANNRLVRKVIIE